MRPLSIFLFHVHERFSVYYTWVATERVLFVITALGFFFLDFFFYSLFDQWLISSLVAYFVYSSFQVRGFGATEYGVLGLILLQDFFLYGRFGLGLVWFLPLVAMIRVIRVCLQCYWWPIISCFLVLLVMVFESFAAKSTSGRIFGTMTVMAILTFFGTWGNRFLFHFGVKRGKSGLQTGGTPHKRNFL